MVTSVLMASHDHNTNLTLSEDHLHHHHPNHRTAKQNNISTPRRKLARGNEGKKKQPQRGMGVAKLERLRLGERWKKMTEINPYNSSTPSSSLPYAVIPASFAHDPTSLNTVPLHLAKYGAFAASSTTSSTVTGVGGLNLNQPAAAAALLVPRVGLFHGQGLVTDHHDDFHGNLYGVGNGSETSKELFSTPNMINSYPDHCSVCHQRKRNFVAQNLVYKGVKDINAEMPSSITCSDFAGLNVSNSQNNKGRTRTTPVFGKNASFRAGSTYSVSNIDQGIVDVVTVHRKGSSSGVGNGSFFMEYEFFPASGNGSRSIDSHEPENELIRMMKNAVVSSESSSSSFAAVMMGGGGGGGGDTSCLTTTTSTCGDGTVGLVDASSSIDLSLRLSY